MKDVQSLQCKITGNHPGSTDDERTVLISTTDYNARPHSRS